MSSSQRVQQERTAVINSVRDNADKALHLAERGNFEAAWTWLELNEGTARAICDGELLADNLSHRGLVCQKASRLGTRIKQLGHFANR